ncbi:TetR family transcriptional regulator [Curtobacterium sp. MMLR14_010]|uniref:TetR/AcrR family transcriptional regulator n=1 Tax=Curtobacterium sp. MMLR14_010 TaxID=1898743 RepID=UPI0008DC9526|nr:TetR/AcrR family transcriptional regulator [Curtobacterium sp. MMLR14_010]OII39810.1 TetR family transcriptional regulator [Curtobacterium sp. MMLR14_010]
MTSTTAKPMRADARRNRDAITAAARQVFETDGILAPIDGIATAAGVGNATFYRNFPTRDDLLAAVMADSVHAVLDDSRELESLPADDALHEWMARVTWQLRIWQNLPTCIASAIGDDQSPVQDVCARLTARTDTFLQRARTQGSATDTASAEDVFELLTTLSWGVDRFGDDQEQARRRVRLATAGLFGRSPHEHPGTGD